MKPFRGVAFLVLTLACAARGQTQTSRLSLAELHQLLQDGLSSERLQQSVAALGLSFELSGDDAESLLKDGATPALVAAVRARDVAQTLFDEKRYVEAKERADADARAGSASAMRLLGRIYLTGNGAPQDYGLANDWFRRSAALGDAAAMSALGNSYRAGTGVTRDFEEALRWYRKADEGGAPGAADRIGQMYASGQGIPRDERMALTWYRKAAEEGLSAAMDNVGVFYMNARTLPRDYTEAMRWYRKAAVGGYPQAWFHIGLMYERGMGVQQDLAEAARSYRLAATAGDPAGMYRLALAYEGGNGVDQDSAAAMKLFAEAAAAGSRDAAERLGNTSSTVNSTGGTVLRVVNGVSAPVLVSKVDPVYSEEARVARLGGTVTLAAIVDATGNPRDIHVIQGLGMGLDEKAIEAVQQWKFKPGMKDGKPVNVRVSVQVNFRLLARPGATAPLPL